MRLIDADAFKEWLMENSINERERDESRELGMWIDAFPSAEPEHKNGKWMRLIDIDGFVQCSSCGAVLDYSIIETLHFPFCPNCGSYNGGEQ